MGVEANQPLIFGLSVVKDYVGQNTNLKGRNVYMLTNPQTGVPVAWAAEADERGLADAIETVQRANPNTDIMLQVEPAEGKVANPNAAILTAREIRRTHTAIFVRLDQNAEGEEKPVIAWSPTIEGAILNAQALPRNDGRRLNILIPAGTV